MPRRTIGLSERHRKIIQYLTNFQDQFGFSPSIREIGDSIGVKSTSLVDYYLHQLQKMGHIQREEHISRSIRILKSAKDPHKSDASSRGTASELLTIPVVGRIVASLPIPVPASDLAYYDPESSVEIARSLLPPREKASELFALEVEGESMIDAMVNDGDIIVMKKAENAANGEMVAVWFDDENSTTLKYFYREDSRIRLQPANPTMRPIFVENPSALHIMGKVIMVIRQVKTVGI